ncbi:MAG: CPBP family intramembrane glutamic endopeptidase [Rhizomicrobium sp.]
MNVSRHRPFAVFYAWTFAIPFVLALLFAYYPEPFFPLQGGPFVFLSLMHDTMARSGVTLRGGALLPLLQAVWGQPVLVIAVLASAIPSLVAIVLVAMKDGAGGLASLFGRLRPWLGGVKASEGLSIWLRLMAVVVAVQLVTFVAQVLFSGAAGWTVSFNPALLSAAAIPLLLEAMFLNQGGLLEELGFRGYGLPLLQGEMSPIKASVVLGLFWAFWHVSRDILFQTPAAMGLFAYGLILLPLFAIWCVGATIVMAYFFNRTGGSVLATIAVHGFLNDGAQLSGIVLGGNPMFQLAIRAVVVGGAGLLVFLIAGRALGRRGEDAAAKV